MDNGFIEPDPFPDEIVRTLPVPATEVRRVHDLAVLCARRLIRSGELAFRRAGERWTEDEAEDLVQEAWCSGRIEVAWANSVSDQQLRSNLRGTLRQQAIDLLRASGDNALYRRLRKVLAAGDFSVDDKWWSAGTSSPSRYEGTIADLVAAAFAVDIRVLEQKYDARTTSFASRADLEAVLAAVFVEASGAVHVTMLVDVIGERVGNPTVRGVGPIDDFDAADLNPLTGPDADALELVGMFDDEERAALPHLELSDIELGKRIGVGKTKASAIRKRVRAKIGNHGQEPKMFRTTHVDPP